MVQQSQALAIRPRDLAHLRGPLPTLHVCGTLVEPRKGFVDALHRQDTTKTRDDRTLILPGRVIAVLRQRMERDRPANPDAPVFGTLLSPTTMRTRLRRALSRATRAAAGSPDEIHGTSFHTLRRTVGTLLAHEVSLDAARELLGHRDPSVTYQHDVGRRALAPDVREVLDRLLADLPPGDVGTRACLELSSSVLGVNLVGQTRRSTTAPGEPPRASRDSSRDIGR